MVRRFLDRLRFTSSLAALGSTAPVPGALKSPLGLGLIHYPQTLDLSLHLSKNPSALADLSSSVEPCDRSVV